MLFVRNWWILALRGIAFIIFGLYFFFYPDLTIFLLGRGFLLFSATDGILCLLIALFTHKGNPWRVIFLVLGLLGLAAALLTFFQPLIISVLLFTSIAPWIIFTGVLEIAAARIFQKEFNGTGWLTMSGIISLALGGLLLIQPWINFPSIETLIGSFQIVRGVVNVFLAFGLKHNREKLEPIFEPEI